jgi:hypothetical protein
MQTIEADHDVFDACARHEITPEQATDIIMLRRAERYHQKPRTVRALLFILRLLFG